MALISALLGNASEIDVEKLESEFSQLLVDGEEIHRAYKMFRDLIVFTNLRLFLVDKQGMTGKKSEYISIPYKSIDFFSEETSGHFDLDSEIKIWIKSRATPIQLEFKRDPKIHEVYRTISHYVLTR